MSAYTTTLPVIDIGGGDGCTNWFDGTWRHCCDAHDAAYAAGTVSLQSHLDLGACVAVTSGGPLMGALMAVGTALWWIVRHRAARNP